MSIESSRADGWFCSDLFFISTLDKHHIEKAFFATTHEVEFKNLDAEDRLDIAINGVRLFMFCDGLQDTIASAIFTAKMFLGGFNVPFLPKITSTFSADAAIEFLQSSTGFEPEIREIQDTNVNPEEFVKTGDVVLTRTFGGLNALIMYGTGSLVGHSGIAMWIGE